MYIMESGELTEAESSTVAAQIVSIMRYLHKKNIMLRNLSMHTLALSEPCLLTDVKLIDLMMATYTYKLTKEAPDLLYNQIYETKNQVFLGKKKFVH